MYMHSFECYLVQLINLSGLLPYFLYVWPFSL